MITENTIYWITRLDQIIVALKILGATTGIIGMTGLAIAADKEIAELDTTDKDCRKLVFWSKFLTAIGTCLLISSIFIPTTKEMIAIKGIPAIVNNEQVQQLPGHILELIEKED